MNALVFLFLVLVVSGIGSAILWYQHRSPNTLESGIEAFQREMEALAPPDDDLRPDRRDGPR